MPGVGRVASGGVVQDVWNRRGRLFGKSGDYDAFLRAMPAASAGVLGWCLMPNHCHLGLWPTGDGKLRRFMQGLTTTHVRRADAHRGRGSATAGGHPYQGRFKGFPVQEDLRLTTVLRYVEGSAERVRLGLSAGWGGPSGLTPGALATVARVPHPRPVDLRGMGGHGGRANARRTIGCGADQWRSRPSAWDSITPAAATDGPGRARNKNVSVIVLPRRGVREFRASATGH